ncbi:hypothetical protein Ga0609869_000251 [Rhodovulum iodosum]|uniref:Helix-turn-helix domain-containing protein n=1 Tax=Rhodovulum iodosum TaxID=68291 RepID=A0ABV3XR81_9RHOB|nr:hypothetical protein [Rhodovulum robiginosum]RSK34797.1 hypothetical protein EJA01_07525 [Rhodovulum robiginosum]
MMNQSLSRLGRPPVFADNELAQKALALRSEGKSVRAIANAIGVSKSSVARFLSSVPGAEDATPNELPLNRAVENLVAAHGFEAVSSALVTLAPAQSGPSQEPPKPEERLKPEEPAETEAWTRFGLAMPGKISLVDIQRAFLLGLGHDLTKDGPLIDAAGFDGDPNCWCERPERTSLGAFIDKVEAHLIGLLNSDQSAGRGYTTFDRRSVSNAFARAGVFSASWLSQQPKAGISALLSIAQLRDAGVSDATIDTIWPNEAPKTTPRLDRKQ